MCADILAPPNLNWDSSGEPHSNDYQDVYFTSQQGRAETHYVFLQHNDLPARFAELKTEEPFCIAETGFGSGLNFYAAVQLWQQCAPSNSQLHFISVEKNPFRLEDMKRCAALWPDLRDISDALLSVYPTLPYRGFHRFAVLPNITLTLIFDEAIAGLSALKLLDHMGPNVRASRPSWGGAPAGTAYVDAWFLDGFAPSKNPDMWQSDLFACMATLSKPDASFATFTAAGLVKRGLQQAGFEVNKCPGFGKKRDMLYGKYVPALVEQPLQPQDIQKPHFQPHRKYSPSWHCQSSNAHSLKDVVVVGAGLAGAHTARALAERGCKVKVLEKGVVAQGGSGNPKGVVYTTLSNHRSLFAEFNVSSYVFAIRHYKQCGLLSAHNQCGVIELADSEKTLLELKALAEHYLIPHDHDRTPPFVEWLDAAAASAISGVQVPFGGLYFPQGGWLSPRDVCLSMLDHPNIQVQEQSLVTNLSLASNNVTLGWQLQINGDQAVETQAVVLACADQTKAFDPSFELPIKTIRGQVSTVSANSKTASLKTVLCGKGYICPADRDQHELGATFDLRSKSLDVTALDHQHNLESIKAQSDAFLGLTPDQITFGRAALRCTSPDYLPLVGALAKRDQILARFERYSVNAKKVIDAPGDYWPGLFVNIAHGSRGLTYIPLCAEMLADQICGRALPVSQKLALALHPTRFTIRDLAKNLVAKS